MATTNSPATSKEGVLVIERIFDAPREVVWKAWSDPERFKRWWGPKSNTIPVAEIDFRVGGSWLVCDRSPEGRDIWSTGVYREIAEPARIVFMFSFADEKGNPVPASHYGMTGDWPPEMLITVTFEEEAGKTRMTLRHAGIPAGEMSEMTGQGWSESLDKLAESLAGPEFVITRTFDAPRDLVWEALTEPERLKHWWGPKGFTVSTVEVDLRPGGVFFYGMRTPDGHEFWGKWGYREIVAPERIVSIVSFTDEMGNPVRHPMEPRWPLEILGTMTLAEHEGKTSVTVRTVPYNATEEERKVFFDARDSMEEGFTGTFDQLADYLAKVG